MTTTVVPVVCFLDGQVTFLSSTLTSLKNSVARWIKPGSPSAASADLSDFAFKGLVMGADLETEADASASTSGFSLLFFFSPAGFFFM